MKRHFKVWNDISEYETTFQSMKRQGVVGDIDSEIGSNLDDDSDASSVYFSGPRYQRTQFINSKRNLYELIQELES